MDSLMIDLRLRSFQPGDEAAFRSLNEDWIAKLFAIEEPDRIILGDPLGQIIEPGGHIFLALDQDRPIGCCALVYLREGEYELVKMTVAENYRGQGIGRELLRFTIEQARAIGATRVHLETSWKLTNAIHLYESMGFQHIPPDRRAPSPYARATVFMELLLPQPDLHA